MRTLTGPDVVKNDVIAIVVKSKVIEGWLGLEDAARISQPCVSASATISATASHWLLLRDYRDLSSCIVALGPWW
jgi:hypothetical protein